MEQLNSLWFLGINTGKEKAHKCLYFFRKVKEAEFPSQGLLNFYSNRKHSDRKHKKTGQGGSAAGG